MKKIKGSITAPKGFLAAAVNAGIKNGNLDLGLIYSKVPALAAGIFTKNEVRAAPVEICQKYLRHGRAQAIVVNSGNANCLCGREGFEQAVSITESLASLLAVNTEEVLIASTGIIGKPFPAEKVLVALPKLKDSLTLSGEQDVAKAILTTDLTVKKIAVSVKIGGCDVKIGGICKGSGMIHPDMATMLCFVTTDACIEASALRTALSQGANESFNALTVDGDMSTNDAVIVLANAQAGNRKITTGTGDYKIFYDALKYVTLYLAKEIARDGEGASKFIEVNVKGARNDADAKKIAFKIAGSSLVKTAIAGEDPNVGRIAAAAGAAGVKLDLAKFEINLNGLKIMSREKILYQNRPRAKELLKNREIKIAVNLNSGNGAATVWTCDLTEGYIKINARYN